MFISYLTKEGINKEKIPTYIFFNIISERNKIKGCQLHKKVQFNSVQHLQLLCTPIK